MSPIKQKRFMLSTLTVSCLMAFNAQAAVDCTDIPLWESNQSYSTNSVVQKNNTTYKANWWSQGNDPEKNSGEWQEWTKGEQCNDGITPPIENQAPTASLTSPSASDQIAVGEQIMLTAAAQDSDGTIQRVEFLVNGMIVGTSTKAPYQVLWTATKGQQTITVLAVDDQNTQTESQSVTLSITATPETENKAPTASLTLSSNEANKGDVVTLTAAATDEDGTIDKVDFYVAGNLVDTSATAPYTFEYTTNKSGQLALFARATDNQGAQTDSALSQLTVIGEPTAKTCRPDGLYQTEGVNVPYCTAYDEDGRELMGADHPRRVIGYFTSWRAGEDDQTSYLVNDIPWEQLTHINYAFVSIGADGKVNIGDVNDPNNAAVGKTWNGVEVDPALGFKGHFGALATYKEKFDVKTLISIGGWAETSGHR